jgi:hypothetical protein
MLGALASGFLLESYNPSFSAPIALIPKNPPDEAAASNSPGDLLSFVTFTSFFCDFSPKIACQAPNPAKPNQISNIQVAF